jgi:hypothetical protein
VTCVPGFADARGVAVGAAGSDWRAVPFRRELACIYEFRVLANVADTGMMSHWGYSVNVRNSHITRGSKIDAQ